VCARIGGLLYDGRRFASTVQCKIDGMDQGKRVIVYCAIILYVSDT
jgi:hypothetical protein